MTDHFKEKAIDWDASERRQQLSAAIGNSILQNVPLNDQTSVMDFGAGTGLLCARIAPRVKSLLAVDTSRSMLDKLQAKPEFTGKLETLCQDIVEEPIDRQFDLIISAMTLHHVEDTEKLIGQLYKNLKHGGVIALADLDTEDGSFHPPGTEGVFHSGFDRDALRLLIEKQGFEKIEFHDAHNMTRDGKDYPVFLVIASKSVNPVAQ